jgi:CRP/FNR family cyclic AMP-dependent transcriptional regulator
MKGKQRPALDVEAFLRSTVVASTIVNYQPGDIIFSQGDPADTVLYIQNGAVKLSVLSPSGKEAVLGMLGSGDFLGEQALAGHSVRLMAATAVTATSVLNIPKQQMNQLLHTQHAFSDRFIAHMLARNIRVEEDLVDQLFNSSEKRLARTLLLLANFGKEATVEPIVGKFSQETLAEMIGTTRSRVSFFMNKFRKLGYIEYNGKLEIRNSLLNVVLYDKPEIRKNDARSA